MEAVINKKERKRKVFKDYRFDRTKTHEDCIEVEMCICATFGCTNILSLMEKLCGTKCIACQQQKKYVFHNGKL